MKLTHHWLITAGCGLLLTLPATGRATPAGPVTLTPIADTFLATGSASNPLGTAATNLNFGGAGTLAISPASSPKGEYDSLMQFSAASAVTQFNTAYGAGGWTITGFTLSLASNFGTNGSVPNNADFNTISGGSFGIDLLGNNSWVEGTGGGTGTAGDPSNSSVTYNSIPALFAGGSDGLGTFTYAPPGNNAYASYILPLNAGLLADAAAGGDISLYLFAADSQISYLINSRTFASNHPELIITAAAAPEPATTALLATALGGWLMARRRTGKK